jgi:hypothetical protein
MKLCNLKVLASEKSYKDFYVFEEMETAHTRVLFVLHANPKINSFIKLKFAETERDFPEALEALRIDLMRSLTREKYRTLCEAEANLQLQRFPNVLAAVGKSSALEDSPLQADEGQLAANLYLRQPYRQIKI